VLREVTAKRAYSVYVIELDPEVLTCARFRKANPDWQDGKPCVYVGSTSLTPEERFRQHLAGYKANRYARAYGFRLRPRLYQAWQHYETRKEAEKAEEQRALSLRKRGYAVWYGV
jgi:hypothetical protein